MAEVETIEDLAVALSEARMAEANAREIRIEIEEKIAAAVECGEQEATTVKTEVGLKLTVKRGFNYSLASGFDPELVPTKTSKKTELDKKAYEALRESNPEAFKKATQFVTVKPRKVAVSLAVL